MTHCLAMRLRVAAVWLKQEGFSVKCCGHMRLSYRKSGSV
jgi:hypothetical protein